MDYKIDPAEVDVREGWTCVDMRPIGGISHFIAAEDESFAISYNPDTSKSFIDALMHAMGAERGGEETALIVKHKGRDNEFYILQGDWRAAYEPLVPLGLQACREFYERNKEHRSMWSDDAAKDMRNMA